MDEGARGLFETRDQDAIVHFDGDPGRWAFGDLPLESYGLMMIDPAWPTEMRSKKGEVKSHTRYYESMSFERIAKLPVRRYAAKKCGLFVWGVWPHVLYGGDPKQRYRDFDAGRSPIGECIHEWGARVVAGGVWRKMTRYGKVAFGPGYRVRSSCEPFFLAVFGNPPNSKSMRNIFDGLRRGHSEKPDEAYRWCERWMPGVRRLEVFSRRRRPGWDTCGNEAGMFAAAAPEA